MEPRATGEAGHDAGYRRRIENRDGHSRQRAASLPLPPRSQGSATARRSRSLLLLLIGSAALLLGGPTVALPPQEEPATAQAEGTAETVGTETAAAEETADDPMQPLAPMVGEWKGEGWMRMGPGEPVRFDSHERVESRLGGEALFIEGTHHAKDGGQLVHNAVALLSHDASAGLYRFRSHVHGRGPGDFEGRVEDGAFIWGGAMGPGQMRYTIRIDGDRWNEVGEFSQDGETWRPFFEMNLERIGG